MTAKTVSPAVITAQPEGMSVEIEMPRGPLVVTYGRDPVPREAGAVHVTLTDEERAALVERFGGMPEAVERRQPQILSAGALHLSRRVVETGDFARRVLAEYLTSSHARTNRSNVATETLEDQGKRPEAAAHAAMTTRDVAIGALERALLEHLEKVASRIDALGEGVHEASGIMAWDAYLAEHVEGIGETGRELAGSIRRNAPARWAARDEPAETDAALRLTWARLWRLWLVLDHASAPLAVSHLATVLWREVVGPRIDRASRKPAALVRTVHTSAMHFHSRIPKFDAANHTLSFEGRKLAALYGASFDLGVIERGLGLLGSVAAHRLFRWEVITGHERALREEAYPNILDVEGGWSGLARLLGLNPDKPKVTSDLRAIVHAQAHFRFDFPDGSHGNMLSYTERAAEGRNQRARVTITLGSPLLPGYTQQLKGAERKLVPMLSDAPPLYGRPNEHGQQMTMSLAVMAELRERAVELVTEGGVCLSHDDWTRLADRSGVPRRLAVPIRDHWLQGDTRSTPFLKEASRDRFTLADAHTNERSFLEEAGRAERDGAEAGRKSAAKRRAKVARLGKRK